MKKPVIDWGLCEGCGSCSAICPEVFETRENEGKAYVIGTDKCNTCDCKEAADVCPVQAITFIEE